MPIFRPHRSVSGRVGRRLGATPTSITRRCLDSALACAASSFPNEFGGILRADPPGIDQRAPAPPGDDVRAAATRTSSCTCSPSTSASRGRCTPTRPGALHPSEADLTLFRRWGRRHLILGPALHRGARGGPTMATGGRSPICGGRVPGNSDRPRATAPERTVPARCTGTRRRSLQTSTRSDGTYSRTGIGRDRQTFRVAERALHHRDRPLRFAPESVHPDRHLEESDEPAERAPVRGRVRPFPVKEVPEQVLRLAKAAGSLSRVYASDLLCNSKQVNDW